MAEEAPVLIAGIDAIARALGVSSALVKSDLLRRPGFPAHQISARGTWVTTRPKLAAWADMTVPEPSLPPSKRPSRSN